MPILMKHDNAKITFEIKRVITVSLKYVLNKFKILFSYIF